MSDSTESLRSAIDHTLDVLEMAGFNDGFEAAINAIDELSNQLHNNNDSLGAEVLRWAAKELRGEND
jgi:hypothetical protein